MTPIILSRVPFRLPLGGGSTDLPSYYEKFGGFIFAAAINLYMDILIKETRSDDFIHILGKNPEVVSTVDEIKHPIARQALKMHGVQNRVSISFKADTPAGTGLGSSGACAVAVLKGLGVFQGRELSNREAAERSFQLTQALGLPDGVQDLYACAYGGFTVLEIGTDGSVRVARPRIAAQTTERFFGQTLFYYTGVMRDSEAILAEQDKARVLELKHRTKEIGRNVYQAFCTGDLDTFGTLMDEHWNVKKEMSGKMSSARFDHIYETAKRAGALGGKIMGAGGGGYFMFYCPSPAVVRRVREALQPFGMREMSFALDTKGARTKTVYP